MREQPAETKHSSGALIFAGVIACALAYVITKEIYIPKYMMVFGALIGGILLLLKGMVKPEMVTYVLVAYLPFSDQLAGDFGGLATAFNLTNIFMAFLIFIWCTGRFAADEPLWMPSSLNIPIALFVLIGMAAVIRGNYYETGHLWNAIILYKRWITPYIIYFLVLNTVKKRETVKDIVTIVTIATTLAALMAIYDYMNVGAYSSLERSRMGGIVDQPNMLAAFFNYYMFIPLGFFLMNAKKFKYWLLWIPFLLQFRGVMVTFSRGGYMAFALGLYAIIFFRSKLLFILLIFATWLAVLNPILLPAGIRYRMGQTFQKPVSYVDTAGDLEGSLEMSAQSRVEVWKGGLAMIKNYPLFGVGYGLFQSRIQYYWSGQKPIDAHNTYLIIAAEMGIPALIIFLWLITVVFFSTYALYRMTADPFSKALALGFMGGLFGLLMSNMFGSRLDSQEISSYFWILAALIERLRILDRKEGKIAVPQSYTQQGHKL